MTKKSVAVYCSARNAIDHAHISLAHQLGLAIARDNMTLIYGGGGNGMMGSVARACYQEGGEVIGVIPKFLQEWEGNDNTMITRTIITETMSERKRILTLLSDGCIVMAGGLGTLEELMEVLTLKNLKQYTKPIILLDPHNHWQHLLSLIDKMIAEKFCGADVMADFIICDSPDKAVSLISAPSL